MSPKPRNLTTITFYIGLLCLIAIVTALYLQHQSDAIKPVAHHPSSTPSPTSHPPASTPAPTPTAVSTPTPTPSPTPPQTALACVQQLPNTLKLGQKLMFAGYASTLQQQTRPASQAYLGGLILMNQVSAQATQKFTQSFTIPPSMATDQEGGSVMRYTSHGSMPSAATMAASYSPDQAYQIYLKDAQFLHQQGITVNLAPVVDVISRQPNPLPNRLYSSSPQTVIQYATSFIKASQKAGLTPVIKHFPGLGSATGNTDYGPASTDPLNILKSRDLLPYQKLASLKPDVMASNASTPGLTHGQPAIWSPAAIALLRSYGYQNSVIYTDSLTAQAIPGYLSGAAIKAWQADIDIALIVQSQELTPQLSHLISTIITQAQQAVSDGQLSQSQVDQSVLRIFQRKSFDPCVLSRG